MSFFTKIASFLGGGVGGKIVDKLLSIFPDKLTDGEKESLKIAILQATREHELALLNVAQEQDVEFNNRIKDMEGTASDLKNFGIVGKFIVLLRGLQRPLWGYCVLGMDFMVFSGRWNLVDLVKGVGENTVGTSIESAFWVINTLVLGFLFGERSLKNVLPLCKGMMGNRRGDQQ